jgi:hypothetical protein
MTPHPHRITTPSAWRGDAIGGKAGLIRPLSPSEIAAFDEAVARTRHLGPVKTARADFDHPAIGALITELDHTIRHGRGAVVLTGLTRATHSEEDMERIYWGIGVCLGQPAVQSSLGERLGHVRHVKDDPVARGYRSNQELTPHTDPHNVIGLMCLQRAETGGLSRIVSSLSVHNEILARRPDLLEPLYEGYHFAIAEAQFSEKPVTDFKIPVFCAIDGQVGCGYVRGFMERAAKLRDEALPPKLVEAMDLLDAIAIDDSIGAEFMLEPGEMMFWHNFHMLHARGAYEDSPAHTRHLLRHWLRIENDRPMAWQVLERGKIYERVHAQKQGRVPASLYG